MKITEKIKDHINEYYSFGDQTRVRRYGIEKGKIWKIILMQMVCQASA